MQYTAIHIDIFSEPMLLGVHYCKLMDFRERNRNVSLFMSGLIYMSIKGIAAIPVVGPSTEEVSHCFQWHLSLSQESFLANFIGT